MMMQQLNSGVGDKMPLDSKNLEQIAKYSATEATQKAVLKQLQNSASSVWTDDSGAFYIRRDIVDDVNGTVTVTYTTPTGVVATPGAGLKPATGSSAGGASLFEFVSYWVAKNLTSEYALGDTLAKMMVLDVSTSPATIVLSVWQNVNTGNLLTAVPSNITLQSQSDVATEATLAKVLASIGAPEDAAWGGTGNASEIALLKNIATGAGTDATGVVPPAGATGIRGWLSGIYSNFGLSGTGISQPTGGSGVQGWLSGIFSATGTDATGAVAPSGATGIRGWLSGLFSSVGTDATGVAQPTGGAGLRGWISGLYNQAGANPPVTSGVVDAPPNSGKGVLGWLSGIYNLLGKTQRVYKITVSEVSTGSLTIPAGKQQIDVANIGTATATVKSASMFLAANLYPVSLGGASLSFRAADAGTLEALTITCPAGAQVQYTMTE
jgi:hypothetical protein